MNRGFFISVEGTDGCGKTTQLKFIEEYLKNKNVDVLMMREPGGTAIGESIRNIILSPENSEMEDLTEMLLYAASRAQLVGQVIKPALSQKKVIVCDRFLDSSIVYQGAARGIGMENVYNVNLLATRGVMPDLTLFLEMDPRISMERRAKDSIMDRLELEGLDFQYKVFHAYKELALKHGERIKSIDASKTVEEVFENIKSYLDLLLGG